MSSSACTLLPSLDTKVWPTPSRLMMGEDKPSPPDGTLVAADDSAAAGSTGITITRFRHPIMAIPDFGRNRNVADKVTLLGKLPCGKAIWPATSSEILSL